eukprot:4838880-Amphidinium_carterae.2
MTLYQCCVREQMHKLFPCFKLRAVRLIFAMPFHKLVGRGTPVACMDLLFYSTRKGVSCNLNQIMHHFTLHREIEAQFVRPETSRKNEYNPTFLPNNTLHTTQ